MDELILTPIETTELKARVNHLFRLRELSLDLMKRFEEVQRLSVTDDVSGFHNTRFVHHYLDELLARREKVFHTHFEEDDRIIRYGGDGHVIILPDRERRITIHGG